MADHISPATLEAFFQELGKRYPMPATLYLLGGGALILLGSSRNTLDVDYVGIDIPALWTDLQQTIAELALEMEIKIEAVPYNEMIPPLRDSAARQIPVGIYGNVQVVVIDPYAMALGKLDRGFPTDLEDIVFLVRHELVNLNDLEKFVQAAIPRAQEFDLTPHQMRQNLQTVRQILNET